MDENQELSHLRVNQAIWHPILKWDLAFLFWWEKFMKNDNIVSICLEPLLKLIKLNFNILWVIPGFAEMCFSTTLLISTNYSFWSQKEFVTIISIFSINRGWWVYLGGRTSSEKHSAPNFWKDTIIGNKYTKIIIRNKNTQFVSKISQKRITKITFCWKKRNHLSSTGYNRGSLLPC